MAITKKFNRVLFSVSEFRARYFRGEGGKSVLILRLFNTQEEGSFQHAVLLAYATLFDLNYCQMLFLVFTQSFCQAVHTPPPVGFSSMALYLFSFFPL